MKLQNLKSYKMNKKKDFISAQNPSTSLADFGGGEYKVESSQNCISQVERDEIKKETIKNISNLRA